MSEYIIVLTTVPDEQEGRKLAQVLVEERLAACVTQSDSCSSLYRWKDAITDDEERMLFIKTRKDLFSQVEKRICQIHPYDVPEILSLPILNGSKEYLDWIDAETIKS